MIIPRWHTSEQWTWIDCINNNNINARNMWWWRHPVVVIWHEAACSSSDDNCLHETGRHGSVVLTLLTEGTRSHLLMKTTSDRLWCGVSWTSPYIITPDIDIVQSQRFILWPSADWAQHINTPGPGAAVPGLCREGRRTSPLQLLTHWQTHSIHNMFDRIIIKNLDLDGMTSELYLLHAHRAQSTYMFI